MPGEPNRNHNGSGKNSIEISENNNGHGNLHFYRNCSQKQKDSGDTLSFAFSKDRSQDRNRDWNREDRSQDRNRESGIRKIEVRIGIGIGIGKPYKSANLLVYSPPQSRRESKCCDSKEGANIQCFCVLPPTSQGESFRELNAISLATQW